MFEHIVGFSAFSPYIYQKKLWRLRKISNYDKLSEKINNKTPVKLRGFFPQTLNQRVEKGKRI